MKLRFPHKGKHSGRAVCEQPDITSPDMNNMRSRGNFDGRIRGFQRPGVNKLFDQQIGGAAWI